jgi:hypothetical protein
MKRRTAVLAIVMVMLYAALAIGAANCLIFHAEQQTAHHHSHTHVAHSALCAWACQANPPVTVHTTVPLIAASTVVAMLPSVDSTARAGRYDSASRSRGPPR